MLICLWLGFTTSRIGDSDERELFGDVMTGQSGGVTLRVTERLSYIITHTFTSMISEP
jgi:hypothetical protein